VETFLVVTRTVPLMLPAGIVMGTGVERRAEPPDCTVNDTTVSIASGCAKLTVPVEVEPPVTVPGLKEKETGEFGFTVTDAVLVTPFAVAET
jgi:hypothetical protein